jgi:circadian clock protein KaiC
MAQTGIVGSVQSPAEVSYIADTLVLLRYFEHEGRVRKALSVVKKRSGGHEDTIREITISPKRGLVVGEPLAQFHGVLTSVPQFHGDSTKLEQR